MACLLCSAPVAAGATAAADLSPLWHEVPADVRLVAAVAPAKAAADAWQSFVGGHHLGVLAEEATVPRLHCKEAYGLDPLAADDFLRAGLDPAAGAVVFAGLGPGGSEATAAGVPGQPSAGGHLASHGILLARIADPNALQAFLRGFAAADDSQAPKQCRAHAGATLCQVDGQDSWAIAGQTLWLAPKAAASSLPAALTARTANRTLTRSQAFARQLRPLGQASPILTVYAKHAEFARCSGSATLWTLRLGVDGFDAKGQLLGSIGPGCLAEPAASSLGGAAPSKANGPRPWLTFSAASLPQAWQLGDRLAAVARRRQWFGPPSLSDWLGLPAPWPAQLARTAAPPALAGGDLTVAGLMAQWRYLLRGMATTVGLSQPKRWSAAGQQLTFLGRGGGWQLASNEQAWLGAALDQAATRGPLRTAATPPAVPAQGEGARPLPAISAPLVRLSIDLVALTDAFQAGLAARAPTWPMGGLLGQWLPLAQLLPSGPMGDRLEDASHLGRIEATVWREQDQLLWHVQQRPNRAAP